MLLSCDTYKKVVYFREDDTASSTDTLQSVVFTTTYQANDLLSITVSAPDPETVKPFNLSTNDFLTKNAKGETSGSQIGYLVDNSGNIDFPVLGRIRIAGLNREQAVSLIKNKLSEYVSQPTVNIQILNFNVTVLGDVQRPGTFRIDDERVSLLEALGYAEDLNITGVRRDVLIIREENGKKIEIRIDLTKKSFLNSPYYYLKQNDIVYVQPNKMKANSGIYGTSASTWISLVSLILTSLFFISK
ncbi:MAG: sugar transporter [Crocinitomicaceae bacterium]|nr:sugar transporter [Crocinitomicaceae bacterium]